MITKKQRIEMKDYLVSKLEGFYSNLEPKTNEILGGIKSNYIFVSPNEVVFFIDQEYPKDSLRKIHNIFHNRDVEVAHVIFKDGKTFFRSASERHYFKKERELSLKNYSKEDMYKMILFRPEEIFLKSRRSHLQYYQPNSQKLNEGIDTFAFENVVFDYSHIPKDKFKPQNRVSERLHIWRKRFHGEENLKVKGSYIVKK